MEYGNGRATMIELDMVYVSYFEDFLSKRSRESFEQNILFRLSPPRKACRSDARPPRKNLQARPEKPVGPAGKACRPGPHLKAAA
jgi:hypothetical protein